MEIKYPKEIASVVRANQTLSITAELVEPRCEEKGESPLAFYDKHFSRFPFTVINQKTFANANISVKEVPNIFINTAHAHFFNSQMAIMPTIEKQESASPEDAKMKLAFGTKISSGYLKGKSPAEVLIENPNNMTALDNQYKFLESHLQQYPANKSQMDAIMAAKELFVQGKLSKDEATKQSTVSSEFVIYESGYRPLVSKKRSDGMNFVYSIKITWEFGKTYPIVIEVINYYAPTTKDARGLYNVQFTQRDKNSVIRNSMRLAVGEWEHIIYIMKLNMRTFENEIAQKMRKLSRDASWHGSQTRNMQENQNTVTSDTHQINANNDHLNANEYFNDFSSF